MQASLSSTPSGNNAKGGGARICGSAVPFPARRRFRALIAATGAGMLWLSAVATLAQSDSPAASTAGEAQTKAPEASSNDIDGETMFATSCGFCHESGGRVAGKGPKLAGTQRTDDFILFRIKNGKIGAMPAFGRAFSDGQIMAILAYIRGLDE